MHEWLRAKSSSTSNAALILYEAGGRAYDPREYGRLLARLQLHFPSSHFFMQSAHHHGPLAAWHAYYHSHDINI